MEIAIYRLKRRGRARHIHCGIDSQIRTIFRRGRYFCCQNWNLLVKRGIRKIGKICLYLVDKSTSHVCNPPQTIYRIYNLESASWLNLILLISFTRSVLFSFGLMKLKKEVWRVWPLIYICIWGNCTWVFNLYCQELALNNSQDLKSRKC